MKILFNKISDEFKVSSSLNKIIYLNIIVFLVFKVCTSILFLFEINTIELLNKFYLPADINLIKLQPWSIFSFMFIHSNFIHLIFNMLWLYFIGNIFLQWLNNKQLIYIYILGGISGGLFFILGYNYFPVLQKNIENTLALGASASIFAIMMAISIYKPNHKIQIPFIKHCPKDRKNFLSYSYVLHKFVELLGLDEYKICFPLLKSREKLHQQDKIWKGICNILRWEFIRSI